VLDQKIQAHLMFPTDRQTVRERLTQAGFDVEVLWDVRGAAFNPADVARFILERVDDGVIKRLAGVVSDLIPQGPHRSATGGAAVGFSVSDQERLFLVTVTGHGNSIRLQTNLGESGP
jgi:hypothetical protein